MSVYFIRAGRYIKVGYSTNPERRFRRLFASGTRYTVPEDCPTGLADRELLRYIDGDTGTEARIHEALSDFAAGLEWFIDEPEVRAFIATAEDAAEYERVVRPGGEFSPPYDETRDLSPEDQERLRHALDGMFAVRAASP